MDHGFKIGDVVQLKSGSPLMTINYIQEPYDEGEDRGFQNFYSAHCVWFKAQEPRHDDFRIETLKKEVIQD